MPLELWLLACPCDCPGTAFAGDALCTSRWCAAAKIAPSASKPAPQSDSGCAYPASSAITSCPPNQPPSVACTFEFECAAVQVLWLEVPPGESGGTGMVADSGAATSNNISSGSWFKSFHCCSLGMFRLIVMIKGARLSTAADAGTICTHTMLGERAFCCVKTPGRKSELLCKTHSMAVQRKVTPPRVAETD